MSSIHYWSRFLGKDDPRRGKGPRTTRPRRRRSRRGRHPLRGRGGNAVAAWVSRVDEAAVRNTQDVDILLRREDLERAKAALAAAGFVFRHVKSVDMFLDGPGAKARDAIHVVFAREKVTAD